MAIVSLIIGILSLIGMFIGIIPCLGSLNWINIPFAALGAIIGFTALNDRRGSSRGVAMTGLILCLIAAVIGLIRLKLGFGIL